MLHKQNIMPFILLVSICKQNKRLRDEIIMPHKEIIMLDKQIIMPFILFASIHKEIKMLHKTLFSIK